LIASGHRRAESHNATLIGLAAKSGHHVPLDEAGIAASAIREIVEAAHH